MRQTGSQKYVTRSGEIAEDVNATCRDEIEAHFGDNRFLAKWRFRNALAEADAAEPDE
jgi:hypothetical protein